MEKSNFDLIIENLNKRIKECSSHLDDVVTKKDLENMTVIQLKELVLFCKKEHSIMDSIINAELYHILGMGNLTAVQQNKFLSRFKTYMSYRSDIKAISSNAANILSLPNLPTSSEYKLTHLADFKLVSEKRSKDKCIIK